MTESDIFEFNEAFIAKFFIADDVDGRLIISNIVVDLFYRGFEAFLSPFLKSNGPYRAGVSGGGLSGKMIGYHKHTFNYHIETVGVFNKAFEKDRMVFNGMKNGYRNFLPR